MPIGFSTYDSFNAREELTFATAKRLIITVASGASAATATAVGSASGVTVATNDFGNNATIIKASAAASQFTLTLPANAGFAFEVQVAPESNAVGNRADFSVTRSGSPSSQSFIIQPTLNGVNTALNCRVVLVQTRISPDMPTAV